MHRRHSLFWSDLCGFSAAGHRSLLPIGPAYLNHLKLSLKHAHDFDALDRHLQDELFQKQALAADGANGEDDLGVGDEPEAVDLLDLDPKEWKVALFPQTGVVFLNEESRNTTTMPYSASRIYVGGPLRTRSRSRVLSFCFFDGILAIVKRVL